jgi:hypothetical protein
MTFLEETDNFSFLQFWMRYFFLKTGLEVEKKANNESVYGDQFQIDLLTFFFSFFWF